MCRGDPILGIGVAPSGIFQKVLWVSLVVRAPTQLDMSIRDKKNRLPSGMRINMRVISGTFGFPFQWRKLVRILDTRFFKSIYIWFLLIPVLAKITSKFGSTITIYPFNSEEPLVISLSLPFDWYVLYFASLAFLLARLIYSVFCPSFLREYEGPGDAILKGATLQSITELSAEFIENYYGGSRQPTKTEMGYLKRFFEQLRIDSTQTEINFSLDVEIEGHDLSKKLANVVFSEAYDKPDYYELERYAVEGSVYIHREQYIKLVYRDLERFLDITYMRYRLVCSIFTLFGIVALGLVAFNSLRFVLDTVYF